MQALNLYRKALAAGDERAIGGIATSLFLTNATEAVRFCQEHISHVKAKVVLGVAYFEGTGGVTIDIDKAERLLKGAASEGSRIAKFNLCILYNQKKKHGRFLCLRKGLFLLLSWSPFLTFSLRLGRSRILLGQGSG